MTALTALTTLAALLGLALWRGWRTRGVWPFYRPVALALCWAPIHDVAQWAIERYALRGLPPPFTGAAALWFHAHAALVLSWPAALLAVALAVFLRRGPWLAVALWAVASAGAALAYPELRQGPRWWAYAWFTALCCGSAFVVGVADIARRLREGDVWLAHHIATMAIVVGQGGAIIAYVRGMPVDDWPVARIAQGIAFAAVVGYQTFLLWVNRRDF